LSGTAAASGGIAFADISGLLYPESVAVIGASDRPGNLGGDTIERLLRFRFPGPVWAVNPAGGTVRGLKCFRTVADLPAPPASVVLAIPASGLLDAIRDCAAVGTKNGVAYAGGFAEAGGEGVALQRRLTALCRELDFKLCGPNCVGILNAATPVTATFATGLKEVDSLRAGPISIVTQSGGIGTAAFFMIQSAGFGCRHMISGGNEAVVGLADYLYGLACDDGTKVIAAYIEGVGDGTRLVRALEAAREHGKPVVMIKAGATGASARAAQAHTGALVGEDRVVDAILQELGVIRVGSVEEMVDVCLMLAGTPPDRMPKGSGVGIITFGGGNGVLAADQCVRHGLTVPALDAERVARVRPLLISVASAANPMDLTPSTAFRTENLAQLPAAMDVIASQPDIASSILIVGSMAAREQEISEVFADFWRRCPKPVCVTWPAPPLGTVARFAANGIMCFDEYDRGLRVLGRLAAHGAAMTWPRRPVELPPLAFDWAAHVPAGAAVVPEDGCHAMLRQAGLPVAGGGLAKTPAEALRIAAEVGLPVALKGITPKVTHRAAAGLLAVDLRNPDEVADGYRRLQARAGELGVALDGIYVQHMERGGVELLVSVFRDPVFGTMISCGSGGGLTEQIDDVVTSRAPVNEAVADSMLARTRLVRHARDEQGPLDRAAAAAFIARLSQLGAGAPWPRFTFEVNPVKWSRRGVVAVDGLLVVEQA
jgi:acyl-CoA synthetase (NDP forming)